MGKISFFILLLCFISDYVSGHECKFNRKNDEQRLLENLSKIMSEYKSPVKDFSEPVEINVFVIHIPSIQVSDIDDHGDENYLTINLYMLMSWKDPCLAWNVSNYGGIETLPMTSSKLWTPKFMLRHTVTDTSTSSITLSKSDEYIIGSDGYAQLLKGIYSLMPCKSASKRLWPYDKMSCTHNLLLDPSSKQKVEFYPLLLFNLLENPIVLTGDWILTNIEIEQFSPSKETRAPLGAINATNGLKLYIELTRDANSEEVYIVSPIFVVTILTWGSLSLSVSSTNKIIMSALSLGMHFYIARLVKNELPKNLLDLPFIVEYLSVSTVMTMIILINSLVCKWLHRQIDIPPRWIIFIANIVQNKAQFLVDFFNNDNALIASVDNDDSTKDNKNIGIWRQIAYILNSVIIFVAGFAYFVYGCISIQVIAEIRKQNGI